MGWKIVIGVTLTLAATIFLGGQVAGWRNDPKPDFKGYIYPRCGGIQPFLPVCEAAQNGSGHCYWIVNQQFNQCQHDSYVASGAPYPGGGIPNGSRPNRGDEPAPDGGQTAGSGEGTEGRSDPSQYVGRDVTVWSMRAAMTPCGKMEMTNSDVGIQTPTWKSASQDMVAEVALHINSPSQVVDAVENRAKECAIQGAAVAGFTAYVTAGSAAWPTFQSYFYGCMKDSAFERYFANLTLRAGSRCNW